MFRFFKKRKKEKKILEKVFENYTGREISKREILEKNVFTNIGTVIIKYINKEEKLFISIEKEKNLNEEILINIVENFALKIFNEFLESKTIFIIVNKEDKTLILKNTIEINNSNDNEYINIIKELNKSIEVDYKNA